MRLTTTALVGLLLLVAVCQPTLAKKEKKGPKITTKVFFDITIGGKEAGDSPTHDSAPSVDSEEPV